MASSEPVSRQSQTASNFLRDRGLTSSSQVHPLRISKNTTPMSSPVRKSAIPRPLSEISPAEKRHNSPSWNQTSKVRHALVELILGYYQHHEHHTNLVAQKMGMTAETSPFQSSPMDATTSPRLFWQNRNGVYNSENLYGGHPGSTSPTRRSSIERLQKASRVKNSSILAQEQRNEYDPTRVPRVERPLSKVQSNSFTGLGITGHQRIDSKTNIPLYSPAKASPSSASLGSPFQPYNELASSVQSSHSAHSSHSSQSESSVIHNVNATCSPSKEQASPIKSSLSSRYKNNYDNYDEYNPESSMGEHDLPHGRILHRHAKSVTFDAAPPQVNEYEMATPDLSSVGSNSREGSYESEEDDDDYDDYRYHPENGHQDDSFDASLEDTDKTPVVGPDDWRHDSPDSRRSHAFNSSPMPDTMPSSAVGSHDSKPSVASGDHRPLPPLPGMGHSNNNSASSNGLSATTEHMLGGSPRGLPSTPGASFTKADIQSIGNNKMTLEERLKLMMLSDDGKSAAEVQRERRMRRGGPKDRANSHTPEPEHAHLDAASEHGEEEDTIGDLSGLEEYRLPPRISRESILRRVNGVVGQQRESDYNFSSPAPSTPERKLPMDPDVPIPSTEHDDDSVFMDNRVKAPHGSTFSADDIYEDEDDEDSLEGDEYESNFGEEIDDVDAKAAGIELASTPRAATPVQDSFSSHTVQEDDIRQSELPVIAQEGRISLGETRAASMTKPAEAHVASPTPVAEVAPVEMKRPCTPEQKPRLKHLSKPEYDGSGWGDDEEFEDDEEEEPGTPESVIHHPVHDDDDDDDDDDVFDDEEYDEDEEQQEEEEEYKEEEVEVQELPAIPEQIATIKSASGSKLKTRASATPSDIMSMREARRQVSREIPEVPAIPERHRSRLSRDMGPESASTDDYINRYPSFKKRSLTLDLDLGLSLDQDFDRVIEAQKVITTQLLSASSHNIAAPTPQVGDEQLRKSLAANDKCSQLARQHRYDLAVNTNIAPRQQRGYLMRQNTKLVAASDKDGVDFRTARSAGNSPIKSDRPQSWTVEPWNGETRRKSIRKRLAPSGPVPPMPGQQSNAAAVNPVAEEETAVEPAADAATEEGVERGRLFVKVMGVKDLDLPIPRSKHQAAAALVYGLITNETQRSGLGSV